MHMCVHAPGGQRTTWSVSPWHLSSSFETGPLTKKPVSPVGHPSPPPPRTGSLSVDHHAQLCVCVGDQTQIFTLAWQAMTN